MPGVNVFFILFAERCCEMIYSEEEILQYIEDNDVKFVKLTFCDGVGAMKNLSIPSAELAGAFAHGVRITARKITGFETANGRDLFLFPDIQTMIPLPWRPQEGRVIRMFCFIRYADGKVANLDVEKARRIEALFGRYGVVDCWGN